VEASKKEVEFGLSTDSWVTTAMRKIVNNIKNQRQVQGHGSSIRVLS
jgi:hypothetical protein